LHGRHPFTGFKGSRKSTLFAAQMAAEDVVRKAKEQGMRKVQVYIKGPGAGRESALRSLQLAGLTITMIRDVTPVPHKWVQAAEASQSITEQ